MEKQIYTPIELAQMLKEAGWDKPTYFSGMLSFYESEMFVFETKHGCKAGIHQDSIAEYLYLPTLNEIPLPIGWYVWQEEIGIWHVYDNHYTDPFDETNRPKGYKTELEARAKGWVMAKNLGLFEK